MAIEAGAKNGIIEPDEITKEYLKNRSIREPKFYYSDKDATYERVITYNTEEIEPVVAFPHLPENTKRISQVGDVEVSLFYNISCSIFKRISASLVFNYLESVFELHIRIEWVVFWCY